jgi:EAL domain-containing protein (putative c-di-GMP-specific phosphodiesterase class I)
MSQLPPQLLKLEVTEGMLITDVQKSIEILHAIRALGIKVSLDDFGTGYSSLSYLRRLPVDQIKMLDKSFFENFPYRSTRHGYC